MLVLFINEVPSSPRNLTVQVGSDTTISVSWLPPENENGIIITYGIYVREQDLNETMRNVSGGETSTSLKALKPYTNYRFRIRAQTIAGWGNFSESKIARTNQGGMYISFLYHCTINFVLFY